MKNEALKQKKHVFIVILSSIMLFVALTLSISYAWITGEFSSVDEEGTKNPVTSITIDAGEDSSAITGTLTLNQTSINKSISIKNNSASDVQIVEVFVIITFYDSEEDFTNGASSSIVNEYNNGTANTCHIKLALADGWSTDDNMIYTCTTETIPANSSMNFITGLEFSDISSDYGFTDSTFYEIFIMITTLAV